MLDLSPKEFNEKREERRRVNDEKAFKDWMVTFKHDRTQDDIIFSEDEDIHVDIKLSDIPPETLKSDPSFR